MLQALWLIYGLTLLCRRNPTTGDCLFDSPSYMPPAIYLVMILNFGLNIGWLLLWDRERLWWGESFKFWCLNTSWKKWKSISVVRLLCSCMFHRGCGSLSHYLDTLHGHWNVHVSTEQKGSGHDWRWAWEGNQVGHWAPSQRWAGFVCFGLFGAPWVPRCTFCDRKEWIWKREHSNIVSSGLAMYATWTTVATLLNLGSALVYRTPHLEQQTSSSIALGEAGRLPKVTWCSTKRNLHKICFVRNWLRHLSCFRNLDFGNYPVGNSWQHHSAKVHALPVHAILGADLGLVGQCRQELRQFQSHLHLYCRAVGHRCGWVGTSQILPLFTSKSLCSSLWKLTFLLRVVFFSVIFFVKIVLVCVRRDPSSYTRRTGEFERLTFKPTTQYS